MSTRSQLNRNDSCRSSYNLKNISLNANLEIYIHICIERNIYTYVYNMITAQLSVISDKSATFLYELNISLRNTCSGRFVVTQSVIRRTSSAYGSASTHQY